jgi:hypothetical protein
MQACSGDVHSCSSPNPPVPVDMSTFHGYFDRCFGKKIRADRFTAPQDSATVIQLLSHVHADHTVGLSSQDFRGECVLVLPPLRCPSLLDSHAMYGRATACTARAPQRTSSCAARRLPSASTQR